MYKRRAKYLPNLLNWVLVLMVFNIIFLSSQNSVAQEKKILFLGNSYTAVNNLPELLTSLALAGGHDIYTDKNTPGGYTLAFPDNGHLYNQTSLDKIAAENWDYVILQEQSQFPVIVHFRDGYTYPGSIELDSIIRDNYECTKTMFYMTWGRKYGGQQCIDTYCSVDFTDYAHMQDSLATAYITMSNYLSTPVSPVGISWKKSIVEYGDPIELFSSDASHPSLAGSYLAACTYYAAIFVESPVGLNFTAGLSESDAAYLQNIAAETVLNNLELWNIDTTTVQSDFSFVQNSGEVTFENLSVNAQEYIWDFGNGDTDTIANPVYTYYEPGQYEVILEAISGCKTDTSSRTIDIVITATNDKSNTKNLRLYPNPATENITIEYHFKDINKRNTICIIDSSGKLLKEIFITELSGKVEIRIDDLTPGNYQLIRRSGDNPLSTTSFVVI